MKKENNMPDNNQLVNKKIAERLEYFNKLDEKERKAKKQEKTISTGVRNQIPVRSISGWLTLKQATGSMCCSLEKGIDGRIM